MGLEFGSRRRDGQCLSGSVCQVGLVQVRGGRIVGEWESLLQPPAGHGWVDYDRGQIHGSVRTAPPRIPSVRPRLTVTT